MRSTPSNSRITGQCNPFLSNGWVNTSPVIGPCSKSTDVIANRDGVSRGVCAGCLEEKGVTDFRSGQLRVTRKLEEYRRSLSSEVPEFVVI
jgi:hypothetical protein